MGTRYFEFVNNLLTYLKLHVKLKGISSSLLNEYPNKINSDALPYRDKNSGMRYSTARSLDPEIDFKVLQFNWLLIGGSRNLLGKYLTKQKKSPSKYRKICKTYLLKKAETYAGITRDEYYHVSIFVSSAADK